MTDRTHPDSGSIITSGDVIAELHARIAELESQLESSGFTAADMATASAQGFRDGVASVSEGAGWISVTERLPEWAARDDTPCFINGKEVPPTLTSETVLVALKGGGVRTDKLTTIEGKSDGWWHTYGERVVAWQKTPPTPAGSGKGE